MIDGEAIDNPYTAHSVGGGKWKVREDDENESICK